MEGLANLSKSAVAVTADAALQADANEKMRKLQDEWNATVSNLFNSVSNVRSGIDASILNFSEA